MADVFKEQIIKKAETTKDKIKKVIYVSIFIILSILTIAALGAKSAFPIIIVYSLLLYYLIRRLNIEYEYTFTNGTLDIDIIYNQSSRKKAATFEFDDVLVMAPYNQNEYFKGYEGYKKIKDFSSGENYSKSYLAIVKGEKFGIKLIIEPNNEMIEAMNLILTPRRLHKRV